MADTFYREPTNHGDANVYHDYIMAQLRCGGRGGLSLELLNTGGALHLSAGFAGIDDGVTKGTIECTADQALSIAAISVGNWASIEASVSGSAVTWHVEDIAGGTSENTIPAAVKAAYNYAKAGYYLVATRRLIGIAFKVAGGTLGRIVNCEDGKFGFKRPSTWGGLTEVAIVNKQQPPTTGVVYNFGSITLQPGRYLLGYKAGMQINSTGAGNQFVSCALSTSAASPSDVELLSVSGVIISNGASLSFDFSREKEVFISVATTYYFIAWWNGTNVNYLGSSDNGIIAPTPGKTIVKAKNIGWDQ